MTRSQQHVALFVVLVGVMIAVYARPFRSRGSPRPQGAAATGSAGPAAASVAVPGAGGATPVSSPGPSKQRDAQRERAAHITWSRDPFLKSGAGGGATGLALSGILWDPRQPMAILNGQMLRVGEELDGYTVVAIDQDRVSVTDGTETFQIQITP